MFIRTRIRFSMSSDILSLKIVFNFFDDIIMFFRFYRNILDRSIGRVSDRADRLLWKRGTRDLSALCVWYIAKKPLEKNLRSSGRRRSRGLHCGRGRDKFSSNYNII